MTLYLITGPPAAGKSTWVRQHAKQGDITIDYDALANALTPAHEGHDHTDTVKAVTKAARQAAIDTALRLRHRDNVDVYVIHSMPSASLVAHYQAHGAQVVTIDPGRAIVLARCKAERPWRMTQAAKEWYATRSDVVQGNVTAAMVTDGAVMPW